MVHSKWELTTTRSEQSKDPIVSVCIRAVELRARVIGVSTIGTIRNPQKKRGSKETKKEKKIIKKKNYTIVLLICRGLIWEL